ncbi:hypothetical protein VSH64_21505 [Amycolatopsis rhabdoformis]|uniref:DUF4239 domain-containing protein n=1 Tax=Amycolatopsis rhabdoformis TaxID=1448059 RepID=A0ABZ1IM39_9PSEU|nr:hypothetical protein [Amycolatopsis rhabdoformis]WSE34624.1 hypothetical protein VSH64_21505 [Amycolatopsis rhabdoformis]
MNGILQGALGGARALLVGWILPSLINVVVFGVVVAPGPRRVGALNIDAGWTAVIAVLATAMLGLVLAALQTPLYRVLEGYLGWPGRLFRARCRRQLARKHLLRNRVDAVTLARRDEAGRLAEADRPVLEAFRRHPVLGPYVARDARKGAVWHALLTERLRRFPSDAQIAATRLGNAIRRFEEYGHDRYLLDSQVLWHELNAVVPEPVRKQVEDGRTNVDFFVSLLYGHVLVAVAAAVTLIGGWAELPWVTAGALVALLVLAAVWYRVAVVATDEWAGAVRAMVNLGRAPLAEALKLTLPGQLAGEREMWRSAGEFVGREPTAALDPYRVKPE